MTWIIQVIVVHGGPIQNILQDVIFVWGDNGVFIGLIFSVRQCLFLCFRGVVGLDPTCVGLVLFELLFVDTV